jgi:repressor LexA
METISDTQRAILDLIAERIGADGMPPSQVEIAKAFGFKGVRAAQYHLEALEAAGAIERVPGRARGIRIKRLPDALPPISDEDGVRLPVLGEVAAGMPIEAGIDYGSLPEAYIVLDRVLFSPKPDYLLKVKGDSMIDEGIFDGDLIGVHRTRDALNNQIVVARIDNEITVKLLRLGGGRVRLMPRNPDYQPIEVQPDQDFAIEGLYCGLVRPNR